MGYGGFINKIIDPFGIGNPDPTQTPDVSKAAADYTALLNAYLGSVPSIQANTAGAVGNVTNLAPSVMQAQRVYNPTQAGLLDTLTSQAGSQLRENGGLDPATLRQVQQDVRSSQAARGMGYGPGDAAQEQYYVAQTQAQRRAQNQALAGNVATQTASTYGDPFTRVMQVAGTPGAVGTGQTDAMLGTTYNAQAAANISTANNLAAANNSY